MITCSRILKDKITPYSPAKTEAIFSFPSYELFNIHGYYLGKPVRKYDPDAHIWLRIFHFTTDINYRINKQENK